ncbi:MAG: LysM peptidoglycan-binding domain-containing protein [Gammaproteobacteria bacterium]
MIARRLGLIAVAFVLGACATAEPPRTVRPEPPAPQVVTPRPAPEPPRPSARETLAASHRDRALELEREGVLRRALDEWKIARAIDPDMAALREGQARLEARIEGLVAERVAEGKAALARGSHVEARRRFLLALALDPGNRALLGLLQNEVRDVEFLVHTVRAGETLAGLAERYYGDRLRSEVIWETNQLPPNPRLAAGTTLKIPEIPGLPFARPRPAAPPVAPAPGPIAVAPSRPDREEQPPEINPLIAEAREALERNDYPTALGDLDKLLGADPGNREGVTLKKLVLYRRGKAELDQKKYDASYKTLTVLARLQPDYEDVPRLLQQTKGRVVDQHYQQGIRLYREEKLPQAIAEWKQVLDIDPQHANAKKNIEQAERLLKGLEQRRKK